MTRRHHTGSNAVPSLCRRVLLVALRGLLCAPAHADDGDATGVRYDRLALVGGSAATLRYLGFRYVDRAWYQGQKLDSIRWLNDWDGATYVNFDKAGHFMGGLFLAQTLNDAYTWVGFGPRSAALLGTVTSWAALLEIEMRDAYFDQWGFSIPDFVANTAGASLPLIHALFPRTTAIRFKFSYFPSALYRDRERRALADQPHIDHAIDDYEGMTAWMTIAIDEWLSGRAGELWPDYLGLGLGYGVVGLHGSNVKSRGRFKHYRDRLDARPEFFLGLDYDARHLPGRHPLWRYFAEQLNWIRFPAPAIRVYPDLRFYLIYM